MQTAPSITGPLTIRDSRVEDADALAALYGHHVLNGLASWEEHAPSPAVMAERRAALVDKGLPHVVATDDAGGLVGFAYAGPYRPRTGWRYTVEDSVYVAPGLHGRGIGRSLLERVIDRCVALGYHEMLAVIGGAENAGSISLHTRMGFRHVGTLEKVGFKQGRWLDSVLMQKTLAPRQPD